ncbi:DUF5672 family protein [Sphingobium sp. DEHP117]|uniref:DUF5672 family protein n=1 Tax=Sphingobium sp. DEHP117 TaxID=2993436 RepID=UPI0027D53658|nr:DUF5672 family protein [Sphingobium sp. DEHP117]MDQ4418960.1 DUF5672 family protein [Sphingobium sp. DEHP117]
MNTSDTLHLPQITLCAVASIDPAPALRALQISLRGIRFGSVKLLSSVYLGEAPDIIEQIKIEPFADINGYSHFMMKNLHSYISTPYVLVVQWDGFVTDPAMWSADFLAFDYIGAPWPQFEKVRSVGNGGFSLRSRRLLEATADPAVSAYQPEDVGICHINRAVLEQGFNIRIAPWEVASRFAFEREEPRSSFGFHGSFNFPDVLGDGLCTFVDQTPTKLFLNRDGRDLCLKMADSSDRRTATAGRKLARQLARLSPASRQSWKTLLHTHKLCR